MPHTHDIIPFFESTHTCDNVHSSMLQMQYMGWYTRIPVDVCAGFDILK